MKNVIEYFKSLNLKDWQITGNPRKGGQAQIIEVKNINTNKLGVFRTLHSKDHKEIERFYRELHIILNHPHPNIVEILDYTKDENHQWYISKKGVPFDTFWNRCKEKFNGDPNGLLKEAIKIITGLTEGLIALHEKNIVHRDIKARNIVMYDDCPVLIDFGIAFIMGEERLTSLEDAMANLYSPDPALNFMEEVPPWLDIFLLGQLLIWMISEGTNKPHVQRPLDWRWVIYPKKLSSGNIIRVRALTAVCSNYSTSPLNAKDFKKLIETLFMQYEEINDDQNTLKLNTISEIIQEGQANRIHRFSDAHSLIEARLPLFTNICKDFQDQLNRLLEKFKQKLHIDIQSFEPAQHFSDYFYSNTTDQLLNVYQTIPISFTCGEGDSKFACGCSYLIYTGKQVQSQSQFKKIENVPVVAMTLCGSNSRLAESGLTKSYYIVPKEGKLELLNESLELIDEISINDLVELVNTSITNPKVWEVMYK